MGKVPRAMLATVPTGLVPLKSEVFLFILRTKGEVRFPIKRDNGLSRIVRAERQVVCARRALRGRTLTHING